MSYGSNMDPDFEKLIKLLRTIIKKHPKAAEQMQKMTDANTNSINLNICIMTLVPMTPEDLEELSDLYEDSLHRADGGDGGPELEFKLTHEDLDFLKNNGLEF
jgi:hypothetical protein